MWPSVLQELKEEKDEVEKNIEKIADGIAGEPHRTRLAPSVLGQAREKDPDCTPC